MFGVNIIIVSFVNDTRTMFNVHYAKLHNYSDIMNWVISYDGLTASNATNVTFVEPFCITKDYPTMVLDDRYIIIRGNNLETITCVYDNNRSDINYCKNVWSFGSSESLTATRTNTKIISFSGSMDYLFIF